MVAAPEAKDTTVEMKEEKTITEQKEKVAEAMKEVIPSGSAEDTVDKTAMEEKALEKFTAGKKALLMNQTQEAVDNLAEACGMMSGAFGELSPKLCEYYYYYGRSLLELARIEEDVLGNALKGEDKVEEEEEGDEEEAEGDETAEEGDSQEETAEEPEGESSQDEDVTSLQLAWEVLELAKTIYLKNEERTDEETLKLSQVYLKLGEVSLENENYTESIDMNKECLKLQESILPADDRWLAETHYQLGLAHSLDDSFDEAVKHLESAVSVIETRIKNNTEKLQKDEIKVTDELDESSLTEDQKSLVTDIKELEKLLPQLKDKITDITETKASYTEKLKAMKSQLTGQIIGDSSGFGEASTSSGAKPISTSLIRKKRKPEEAATPEDSSKKPRTEDTKKEDAAVANGSAKEGEEKKEAEEKESEEEKMETDEKSS